jgi:hypothetical protein
VFPGRSAQARTRYVPGVEETVHEGEVRALSEVLKLSAGTIAAVSRFWRPAPYPVPSASVSTWKRIWEVEVAATEVDTFLTMAVKVALEPAVTEAAPVGAAGTW